MKTKEKSSLFWIMLIGIGGFILLGIVGCGETTTKAESYSDTQGVVRISTGAFSRVDELGEFDYKGHRYIYSEVSHGLAITHAGHCKCNTK